MRMVLTTVASLAVLGGVIGASFVWLAYRRQRQQVDELMRRLDALESVYSSDRRRGWEPGGPAESGDEIDIALSRDVLAGHTSRILRLTAGEAEAATLADQAVICIHQHLDEALTPSELADELCVSLRTFERGIEMALDCTPRQLILAVKMREAWRMLEIGQHNVTEVAHRLGFSSSSHFSRRFTAFFHKRPSEVA